LAAPASHAQSGTIRDPAGFFSEPAKAEASRHIAELGRRFHKDIVVETFREIPEAMRQGVNLQDKLAVNRLFEQWTVQQARQHKVNGIYVLLTKEPSHLQIVVGNDTQLRAFTLKDREALVSLMLGRLRAHQPDAALLEGVNFVGTTMAAHATVRGQPQPATPASAGEGGIPWGTVLTVVLGLAAVWVVIGLFRSMAGGGAGAGAGTGAGAVTSSGGFFSSLLGGMFGAAAGMWLYDQFSGHHGSAWGAESEVGSDPEKGFLGEDSDYSSSGGDFDSDYDGGDSGGDYGGGDSGGDYGGGDSGGDYGGGDSGGDYGGGDF
jgi:uncharacterized protein